MHRHEGNAVVVAIVVAILIGGQRNLGQKIGECNGIATFLPAKVYRNPVCR